MYELEARVCAFLTYVLGGCTAVLKFMNEYAAGIGAMATIIMLLMSLYYKHQHLKIAREQGKAMEEE